MRFITMLTLEMHEENMNKKRINHSSILKASRSCFKQNEFENVNFKLPGLYFNITGTLA